MGSGGSRPSGIEVCIVFMVDLATKAFDGAGDVVGGFHPPEGFRVRVRVRVANLRPGRRLASGRVPTERNVARLRTGARRRWRPGLRPLPGIGPPMAADRFRNRFPLFRITVPDGTSKPALRARRFRRPTRPPPAFRATSKEPHRAMRAAAPAHRPKCPMRAPRSGNRPKIPNGFAASPPYADECGPAPKRRRAPTRHSENKRTVPRRRRPCAGRGRSGSAAGDQPPAAAKITPPKLTTAATRRPMPHFSRESNLASTRSRCASTRSMRAST